MILDPEDEAFNEIERQAKQRKEAVTAAIKAEKAFPNPHRTDMTGMTLRDYFAAASIEVAMRMVKHDLNTDQEYFYWNQIEREIVASRAYAMADAMLEAREA